jgi:hypothetical protein
MTVQIETIAPARRKLVTADRLISVAIAMPLLAVQAAWMVMLLWAGMWLLRYETTTYRAQVARASISETHQPDPERPRMVRAQTSGVARSSSSPPRAIRLSNWFVK